MFRTFKQLRKINKSKLSDDEWYEEDSSGRGIIDVGAENYDDVFSYYDLDGENVLDREFDQFLEAKADAIPLKQELALHFHVKNASEVKRDEIDKTIKNHYKRELRALNRKLHRNTIFILYMLAMFGVFLGLLVLAEVFAAPSVVQYIVDIAAWVFLWEAVDQWFMHRQEIKHELLKKYRFIRADIKVYEYKPKKKKENKFGNNAKSLNKILKQVNKENKAIENKINKIEQITKQEK